MCSRADDPSMHDIEDERPEPQTIEDIAAEAGVPPDALRQALRESHPDASPREVIDRARRMADVPPAPSADR